MQIKIKYDPDKKMLRMYAAKTAHSRLCSYGSNGDVASILWQSDVAPQIEFSVGEVGSDDVILKNKKSRKRKCRK